jgi:hypothetical protein
VNLRCHALKKSGAACGARALAVRDGRPVCFRWQHSFAVAELAPLTRESVAPNDFATASVYLAFIGGASSRKIAKARNITRAEVEQMIREAGR